MRTNSTGRVRRLGSGRPQGRVRATKGRQGETLEIRGSDNKSFVLLTPLFGRGQPGAAESTLDCSCAMAAHRFAGATEPDEPMVRIELVHLRRFVEAVRVLERDRRGEATLAEPQLRLTVSVYDRAGHVRLSAALTDHQVDGEHHVALSFEVDPTALPRILTDLETLLAFPGVKSSDKSSRP